MVARIFRYVGVGAVLAALLSFAAVAGAQVSDNAPELPTDVPLDQATATPTGGLSYSLPIQLPPARAPTPQLALVYNSERKNGLAGVGWTILGIPALARVGGNEGMKFLGSDHVAFLPEGAGTVASPNNYLVDVAKTSARRYHLARNVAGQPLVEFEASNNKCGDGPCYWLMRDGRGNTYQFGDTSRGLGANASFHEPRNGVTSGRGIVVWSLSWVKDVHGNSYAITYGYGGSQLRVPKSIDYSLPRVGASGKSMRVTFDYGDNGCVVSSACPAPRACGASNSCVRPDVTPMPARFDRLLRNIRVYAGATSSANGKLVGRYQLDHTPSPSTGNSLLIGFRQFGSDGDSGGVSLEAKTLTYTSGAGAGSRLATTRSFIDLSADPACLSVRSLSDEGRCRWNTLVGDFDGDGRADLVRAYYGRAGGYVQMSCGTGVGFTGAVLTPISEPAPPQHHQYVFAMGDVNGDGKQDVIAVIQPELQASGSDSWYSNNTVITKVAFGRANCGLDAWVTQVEDTLAQRPSPMLRLSRFDDGKVVYWQVLTPDINGDGLADLVLFNTTPPWDDGGGMAPERVLIGYKISSGGSLPTATFFSRTNSTEWQTCAQRAYPNRDSSSNIPGTFNGVFASDVNNDGRADLVASWSAAPGGPYTEHSSYYPAEPGQITIVTALGGPNGFETPTEHCDFSATSPGVRWPYLAMRGGDINGDGLKDVVLSYQGKTEPQAQNDPDGQPHYSGLVHGRDIRLRLSNSISPAINPNPIQVLAQDGYSYPYPSNTESPKHAATWDFHLADINGDGIDDFIESYRGLMGSVLNWAFGQPTGMAGQYIHGHPGNTTAPSDDGGEFAERWQTAVGDLNGDGRKDVVRVRLGNQRAPVVEYVLGTPTGLATSVTPVAGRAAPFFGNSLYMRVIVTDFNADGRDDVVLINENGAKYAAPSNNAQLIHYMVSPSSANSSGIPDLLSTIDNGVGGMIAAEYRLARTLNAFSSDLPSTCEGASGHISGTICGIPNTRARALLYKLSRNNGRSFVSTDWYEYTNGRVRLGRPSQRADLGFERVRKSSRESSGGAEYIISSTDTTFRQDAPFDGSPKRIQLSDVFSTPLEVVSLSYSSPAASVFPGVTLIGLESQELHSYEVHQNIGVRVATRRFSYVWNWANLALVTLHDGTPFPAVPGEYDFVTQYWYAADDAASWHIAKPVGQGVYRYSGNGLAVTALDLRRTTYDTTRPFNPTKMEQVLFDSSEQSCINFGDPWLSSTCSSELSDGRGRWVTTFQNSVFDSYGNLTSWEGTHTHRPDGTAIKRQASVVYDPEYAARPILLTNALRQSVSLTYDFAGRPVTVRDPNNQTSTRAYDVHGRLTSTGAPGTSASFTNVFSYPGMSADGYRVQRKIYSNASLSQTIDVYLDGFGIARKLVDTSDLGTIYRTSHRSVAQEGPYARSVERSSLPHFSGGAVKYIEIRRDERGRPLNVSRVGANFALDKQFLSYTYGACLFGPGNCFVQTDPLKRPVLVSKTARGLTESVSDASGITNYSYDIGLNLKKVRLPINRTHNFEDMTYDSWGRRKSLGAPSLGYTTFEYDPVGNLTAQKFYATSAMAMLTRQLVWMHDALDRVVSEGDGSSTKVTYTYDQPARTNGIGRLTTVSDFSGLSNQRGTTALNYDARGNIASEVFTIAALETSLTYRYTYNDRDLVTTKVFPDANQKFVYKSDGTLSDVFHNGDKWASWGDWNAFRQPGKRSAYWDGSKWTNVTTFTYDADQRLARLRLVRKDNRVLQDDGFGYDAVGNLTSITDQRPIASRTIGGVNTDATQTYAYDTLDRLCKVGGNNCTSPTYTYDAIGNVIGDGAAANFYSFPSGLLTIENRTRSTVNWRAYHDSEGKWSRFEDCSYSPCMNFYYGYDYRGRLANVTNDGSVKERYTYDYARRRATKVQLGLNGAHAINTWFVGDAYTIRQSDRNLKLYAKTLSIVGIANYTRNTAGLSGTTTSALIDGQVDESTVLANQNLPFQGNVQSAVPTGTFLRNHDRLGTPSVMTRSADGSEVSRYAFDAWGNLNTAASVGYDTSIEKFADLHLEEYSGLIYAGSRYYHPKTKRWTTPDDRVVPGRAQGYNRFAYVWNNPVRYVDPTGHQGATPTATTTITVGNWGDAFATGLAGLGQAIWNGISAAAGAYAAGVSNLPPSYGLVTGSSLFTSTGNTALGGLGVQWQAETLPVQVQIVQAVDKTILEAVGNLTTTALGLLALPGDVMAEIDPYNEIPWVLGPAGPGVNAVEGTVVGVSRWARVAIVEQRITRAAPGSRSLFWTNAQLEQKFHKHAADFGVTDGWRAGRVVFEDALRSHVQSSSTYVRVAAYRGKPAVYYYNNEGLAVITDLHGNFITGYNLGAKHFFHVLGGVLGEGL